MNSLYLEIPTSNNFIRGSLSGQAYIITVYGHTLFSVLVHSFLQNSINVLLHDDIRIPVYLASIHKSTIHTIYNGDKLITYSGFKSVEKVF